MKLTRKSVGQIINDRDLFWFYGNLFYEFNNKSLKTLRWKEDEPIQLTSRKDVLYLDRISERLGITEEKAEEYLGILNDIGVVGIHDRIDNRFIIELDKGSKF